VIGRIFLFGSAVVSLLLLTLIFAVISGQYRDRQPATPTPLPSVAEPSAGSAEPSGSGGAEPSASASGAQPSASATGPQPSASAAGAATVMIANTSFGSDLTLAAGATVTFTNHDTVPHTATNGTDGAPASGSLFNLVLAVGGSGSYTFTEPGTYQVTCTYHPTMNMTITVQ